MSPFSYLGSMESPATSKAIVSSAIGKGSSTSPRPSGGTCSCSGSIAAPAPTRPMIGTELRSRYSMMSAISEALIRRSPDRISETAPGRTPIAAASPPLVLPGFCSPRSISPTSSMATALLECHQCYNSEYQKSSLTSASEYQKSKHRPANVLGGPHLHHDANDRGSRHGADKLEPRALRRAA